MDTVLQGTGTEVVIGPDQPTVIIGNRIHAARNPKIAEAVRRMDVALIQEEARAQAEKGAQVIGVWLGIEDVDEAQTLAQLVKAVAEVVPLPLCLGTNDPEALDAALDACPGKPLVSSITAEEIALGELIPIAMKHNAAIVGFGWNRRGLPREFDGFPNDFDLPFELTRIVLRKALSAGIPREDILIGVWPEPIVENPKAAAKVLDLMDCLSRIEQLNIALDTTCISQGFPGRDTLDLALLTMAMRAGATCCMLDPAKGKKAVLTADLLLGRGVSVEQYRDSVASLPEIQQHAT